MTAVTLAVNVDAPPATTVAGEAASVMVYDGLGATTGGGGTTGGGPARVNDPVVDAERPRVSVTVTPAVYTPPAPYVCDVKGSVVVTGAELSPKVQVAPVILVVASAKSTLTCRGVMSNVTTNGGGGMDPGGVGVGGVGGVGGAG